MKCSACSNNECEGKYENRDRCLGKKEKIECSCVCQVTKKDAYLASAASVGTGVAAAAAGVGLTVVTGGMFAIISGAAMVGAGSSLVLSPIQKYISGERLTLKDTAKDIALGATIGAVTGPIGAAGSAAAKGASTVASLGIRAAAGSAAGAVSGAVAEGARYAKGEEVTLNSITKSMAMGAVVGSVGGASSQIASSLSSGVSNEVGQAATRIAVQGTSAAATDAGLQLYQTGTIDAQQLILNTTGQLTVATTAEVSSSIAQRTNAYNNKLNNEQLSKSNLTPEEIKEIKAKIQEANSIKDDALKSGKKVGDSNIHALKRDRTGQVAADIGPGGENGKRGAGRTVFDKIKGKYVYVDHSMDHDYKGMKATIINEIQNPLDGNLRTDQIQARIFANNINFDDFIGLIDDCDDGDKEYIFVARPMQNDFIKVERKDFYK